VQAFESVEMTQLYQQHSIVAALPIFDNFKISLYMKKGSVSCVI